MTTLGRVDRGSPVERLIVAACLVTALVAATVATGVGRAPARAAGSEQWEVTSATVLTLTATPEQVTDLSCPTADICYVAAFPPAKTVDGGRTWTLLGPDRYPTLLFSAIDCFDALRCVGFENNHLVITVDGGITWNDQQVSTTYSYTGPGACGAPSNCVVIVNGGVSGALALSTRDSGVTWTTSGPIATNWPISDIECSADGLCVAITSDSAHRSTDWGATWTTVQQAAVSDVDCPSAGACFLVGIAGLTRVSPSSVTSGLAVTSGIPTAVACTSGTACVLLTQRFLVGSPVGTRWVDGQAAVDATATGEVGSALFADCAGATCVAIGLRGTYPHTDSALDYVLRSTDGGLTWSVLDPEPARPRVRDVSCTTALHCVWGGTDGRRVGSAFHELGAAAGYTTDGGSTWNAATLPAGTLRILGVECSASGLCVASTVTGPLAMGLVRSTDAGATWSPVSGIAAPNVQPLSCSSATRCVAWGTTSSAPTSTSWIWVTNDAGVTWHEAWTGSEGIRQGACVDADHCVLTRAGSYVTSAVSLLRSADGGETWQLVAPPAPLSNTDVTLLECGAQRCFLATGSRGWYSDDGGSAWQPWTPTFGPSAIPSMPSESMACSATLCVADGVYQSEIAFSEDRGLTFLEAGTVDGSGLGSEVQCVPTTCFILDTLPGVAQRFERLDIAPRAFNAIPPRRVLDTRPGPSAATVDDRFEGIGALSAGSVLALPVRARGGVSPTARAVALNVTVTEPATPGYVTVFPCGESPPLASNVNFGAGETVANAVTTLVGTEDSVCFFSSTLTHLVVDVNGSVPSAVPSITAISPQRILETRGGTGNATIDHRFEGLGAVEAGSVLELPVAGRGGVPSSAETAVLNVTVTEPGSPGYVTVYPCDGPPPNASQLNHRAGQTVANSVTARLSPDGTVCLFALARTHLVVDVSGYVDTSVSSLTPLTPARLLETRVGPGASTVDGRHAGLGPLGQGVVYVLDVRGRGGVPADSRSVVLNVTVVDPLAAGYVTVYPCDGTPPTASSINFSAGDVRANAVVVKIGLAGAVCLFSSTTTHAVVDVNASWR